MDGYAHMNGSGPSALPDVSTEVTVPVGITNQPRVLVRNINENEAVFHLSGVEMAFANSVRRVIMADVPTISEWCALLWFRRAYRADKARLVRLEIA